MEACAAVSDLYDTLICDGCKECKLPPLYICVNGHASCARCKRDVCSECSGSLTHNRKVDLEKLSRKFDHPCPNVGLGCETRLKLDILDQHVKECSFEMFYCPFVMSTKCDWMLNMHLVNGHIAKHNGQVINISDEVCKYTYIVKNYSTKGRTNVAVITKNEVFTQTIESRQNDLAVSICYVGPRQHAKWFLFSVHLSSRSDNTDHIKAASVGPLKPIPVQGDESPFYVTFPYQVVYLCAQDGDVTLEVEITGHSLYDYTWVPGGTDENQPSQ